MTSLDISPQTPVNTVKGAGGLPFLTLPLRMWSRSREPVGYNDDETNKANRMNTNINVVGSPTHYQFSDSFVGLAN
jgi:hypothetical protein